MPVETGLSDCIQSSHMWIITTEMWNIWLHLSCHFTCGIRIDFLFSYAILHIDLFSCDSPHLFIFLCHLTRFFTIQFSSRDFAHALFISTLCDWTHTQFIFTQWNVFFSFIYLLVLLRIFDSFPHVILQSSSSSHVILHMHYFNLACDIFTKFREDLKKPQLVLLTCVYCHFCLNSKAIFWPMW